MPGTCAAPSLLSWPLSWHEAPWKARFRRASPDLSAGPFSVLPDLPPGELSLLTQVQRGNAGGRRADPASLVPLPDPPPGAAVHPGLLLSALQRDREMRKSPLGDYTMFSPGAFSWAPRGVRTLSKF